MQQGEADRLPIRPQIIISTECYQFAQQHNVPLNDVVACVGRIQRQIEQEEFRRKMLTRRGRCVHWIARKYDALFSWLMKRGHRFLMSFEK